MSITTINAPNVVSHPTFPIKSDNYFENIKVFEQQLFHFKDICIQLKCEIGRFGTIKVHKEMKICYKRLIDLYNLVDDKEKFVKLIKPEEISKKKKAIVCKTHVKESNNSHHVKRKKKSKDKKQTNNNNNKSVNRLLQKNDIKIKCQGDRSTTNVSCTKEILQPYTLKLNGDEKSSYIRKPRIYQQDTTPCPESILNKLSSRKTPVVPIIREFVPRNDATTKREFTVVPETTERHQTRIHIEQAIRQVRHVELVIRILLLQCRGLLDSAAFTAFSVFLRGMPCIDNQSLTTLGRNLLHIQRLLPRIYRHVRCLNRTRNVSRILRKLRSRETVRQLIKYIDMERRNPRKNIVVYPQRHKKTRNSYAPPIPFSTNYNKILKVC